VIIIIIIGRNLRGLMLHKLLLLPLELCLSCF
jgi:hypothetical protein